MTTSHKSTQIGLNSFSSDSNDTFEKLFRSATGVSVSVFSYLGHCVDAPSPKEIPGICQEIRSTPEGCRRCDAFHQALLSAAKDETVTRTCPAGLTETAIPIKSERATIGFYLAGQILLDDPNIEQAWVERMGESVSSVISSTPRLSKDRYQAVISLLEREAAEKARRAEDSDDTQNQHASEVVPLPTAVAAAIRFIHANLMGPLSLAEVAEHVALSAEHFSRKFHEATGVTFIQYLNEARVMHAKQQLVESDLPISDIAFDVGFSSLSQFNRVFKSTTGQSPSNFRKRCLDEFR
ncbi:MAG: helix-turn-helix domain-containing protein [Opitutales bacterium]